MNRKTSFITAAAVTGVVLAGTTAVAANIGILNAAERDNIGDLAATTAVTTPAETATGVNPQIIDVYIEDPVVAVVTTLVPTASENAVAENSSQVFSVEGAGTVAVEATPTGVLLDDVTVTNGWEWTSAQRSSTELEVTFTSTDATYVFYASLALDGSITARVDQPIVNIVQASAPRGSSGSSANASPKPTSVATAPSSGSYDDRDDDRYETDDHGSGHDDEHEGGDDDD